jgi:hypothetical protein
VLKKRGKPGFGFMVDTIQKNIKKRNISEATNILKSEKMDPNTNLALIFLVI